MVNMKTGLLDKCLDFAEGKKKSQISYTAKAPNFPENLLIGNDNERFVIEHKEKGLTGQEIADLWGKGYRQVTLTLEIYRKKAAFYAEWIEFWKEIEPVRSMLLEPLIEGKIPDAKIKMYKMAGVYTIGDFLSLCTKMSSNNAGKTLGESSSGGHWRRVKEIIYGIIREQIVLTVRIEK